MKGKRRRPSLSVNRQQRAREAALLLPVVGFLLLIPPLMTIFGGHSHILGSPVLSAYIFGVWLVLIVASWLLARRLSAGRHDESDSEPPDDGSGVRDGR